MQSVQECVPVGMFKVDFARTFPDEQGFRVGPVGTRVRYLLQLVHWDSIQPIVMPAGDKDAGLDGALLDSKQGNGGPDFDLFSPLNGVEREGPTTRVATGNYPQTIGIHFPVDGRSSADRIQALCKLEIRQSVIIQPSWTKYCGLHGRYNNNDSKMKILKLQAENVKRLSVVEIVPRENGLVIVAGDNGQGKSSVLDSIMIALGGNDAIPVKPVRKGEDKAKVVLDIGEFVVTRTMTSEGGGQLVVRDKDLVRQSTPQAVLDGLYSRLSFDPLEFRNQKPAQRSETLRALLGLDFSTIEKEIQEIFDDRTVINRDVRSLQARVEASKEDLTAPKEEESTATILEAQRKAAKQNADNVDLRRQAARAKEMVDSCNEDIGVLQVALGKMKQQLEEGEKKMEQLKGDVKALEATAMVAQQNAAAAADIPLEPFAEKLKKVEHDNAKVRLNKIKADLREQLKNKIKETEDLTAAIDRREKSKRDKIAATQFPVEGLALSDTKEVLYNGIPFDQASTAEQLRISVAMGMAMNPKLRVLLIRQGNDLDANNLKLVADMAVKNDFQIWLERVATDGDVSVIIEDGHVKGVAQKELI